jgi:hypothetical protein
MRRIVRNYNGDMTKVRLLDMEYYIVRKDGAYAGCSLWSTSPTGQSSRLRGPRRRRLPRRKVCCLTRRRLAGVASVLRNGRRVNAI